MPKYDKYYAKWMANIAKCSKYHAKCKVTMPKCSKYHAKWQVLVPNCCKYKANGTGKENKNPYTKPEAKKIKNYSTPEDRGAGSRHFFARETTGQDTAWKEPRGSQRAAARVGFGALWYHRGRQLPICRFGIFLRQRSWSPLSSNTDRGTVERET